MTTQGGAKGYIPIEQLEFFKDLEKLSDDVWAIVTLLRIFERDTVGKQLVRALNSIGANLVEGDGRYSDLESLHFFSIAKGSARETRFWLRRCEERGLMVPELAAGFQSQLESIMRRLSALVSTRRKNIRSQSDPPPF